MSPTPAGTVRSLKCGSLACVITPPACQSLGTSAVCRSHTELGIVLEYWNISVVRVILRLGTQQPQKQDLYHAALYQTNGRWYSLIPRGSAPGVSVGHTCTFIPSVNEGKGRIIIVGGANPSGSFSDSHIINLDNHEWDIPDWESLESRYEHCSFVPASSPQTLWVFGGAQQTGNRNCVQKLQLNDSGSRWKKVVVNGSPPCPRTYHTNSASLGDKLYVFSGGEAGASPVSDPKLHVLDTATAAWSQPETQGKHPPPRHGHIIIALGPKIYIHGGMSGDKFHNDMFSLDTRNMMWEKLRTKGDIPQGVAAHSAVLVGKNIYIFGGMTVDGATNSMYRFNAGIHLFSHISSE
ncbi:hypothetical protein fugu_018782 [Takifugu bimaculatus]|uniref:Rab9 effector protein with kelch motifs n=1 Tax=Takifugu bimaculatus TaxID=433685 RepID=A0A4Z2BHB6_9TELE|nr:hypothetical protein fugu_018782 [Takifugu bimaculatus]